MGQLHEEDEPVKSAKSFDIPKRLIWESYQSVKANGGAAGVDGVSLKSFERNLSRNLYKIWNRMSSGSYFPPPVRRVEIPKKSGGTRALGVPTVADRVAQMAVKRFIEPRLDRVFHRDSYGYRPRKSAIQAVAVTRKRCWQYQWIVEFDIKGAFDNLDHGLLLKAVRKHVREKWAILYIERWLKAPFQGENGSQIIRDKGTPQGGVISPILMNLFMHYAFDKWMERSHPTCPFARYADDAVIHCRTEGEAVKLMDALGKRLNECRLSLHPTKSKIVFCQNSKVAGNHSHVQFTFLGFTFRPRPALNRRNEVLTGFLPAVSREAQKKMRETIKEWRIPRQTPGTLEEFAERYNPVLQGWWNYYGSFYKSEMQYVFRSLDRHLSLWARRKFKSLRGHKRRSRHWLGRVAQRQPDLFVHWRVWGKPGTG